MVFHELSTGLSLTKKCFLLPFCVIYVTYTHTYTPSNITNERFIKCWCSKSRVKRKRQEAMKLGSTFTCSLYTTWSSSSTLSTYLANDLVHPSVRSSFDIIRPMSDGGNIYRRSFERFSCYQYWWQSSKTRAYRMKAIHLSDVMQYRIDIIHPHIEHIASHSKSSKWSALTTTAIATTTSANSIPV